MSDYYIKHFYDQVKDPTWPKIKNYNEFLNLSNLIKDECTNIHNMSTRLNELEDINYWRKNQQHAIGYQYKNLVYVPVLKCANSYYSKFFKDVLGWKQARLDQLDYDQITLFGLMMNPMTRRVKGITQVLCESYQHDYFVILELLQSSGFVKFVKSITMLDGHTIPYTMAFNGILDKIHWIPMEPFTDIELKQQITYFISANGIDIEIPNGRRINQSTVEKEKVFVAIEDIFLTMEPAAELGMLFADDVKFYNNLLKDYATLHINHTR